MLNIFKYDIIFPVFYEVGCPFIIFIPPSSFYKIYYFPFKFSTHLTQEEKNNNNLMQSDVCFVENWAISGQHIVLI